ncbi:ring-infected erythrocyte surface antigen-like [Camponotus floridanus]|uniref:ring-infected erythrocyte surface antigen-like n=1 Tax=Camponotus floridanus TaxID=104421 RepID=UPI000DC69BAF|nr:ring-infected erythrocyte surface antigen-like [Camponotus floridanus]
MKENIKAMNKNTEANKKTKVINKNTEADKKIEKMSENIKRKQIAKMNEDTDEDEYDVNISGYCWNFVLAPENVESDKENGKEKTEKNVKAVKRMKKVKENVEAAQETEKMTTNTEVIKKVRKVSKKTKADKKINEMSKDMENKKYEEDEEDDVYENYQVGKNIEATKETEKRSENTNVDKKIEEICEKQDKIISILENMSKQETTTHKYEKDFKVGKNIEATKETEKRSENTNVDKKIEEISEKQNKKIEGITEKQDKIISILENMSKQEATTHKCDKDFKAGEITTADKEEENNIAAKEIENINKRIEKIENKITKLEKI